MSPLEVEIVREASALGSVRTWIDIEPFEVSVDTARGGVSFGTTTSTSPLDVRISTVVGEAANSAKTVPLEVLRRSEGTPRAVPRIRPLDVSTVVDPF